MKNISYAINGVLAVAIIILFILFFTSKKSDEACVTGLKFDSSDSTFVLPVAYINVDSLLTNYKYAIDENDRLMKKFNSSNSTVTQKQRLIEGEQTEFNRKLQNNAFLSQERAQEEANRIQKLMADYQQMAQRLENEFAADRQDVNAKIADSVRTCLNEYNKTANYQIIFSNTALDNILVADKKYDITKDILNMLNSRYALSPTVKK